MNRAHAASSIAAVAPAYGGADELHQVLDRLGSLIASLIPALMLGYMIVIWPLAFVDTDYSLIQMQLGWMAPFPAGAGETSPLKMIAYPLLFMVAMLCSIFTGSYRRLPFFEPAILSLAAVIFMALASTLWSEFAELTLKRAILLGMIPATLLLSIYSARSFKLMMQALFAVAVIATALNLVAVATQPPGPIGHTGIYAQKNVFGWVAGVLLFFGLYHVTFGGAAQRAASLVIILAAPQFLIVSLSKTSLGLALLAPSAALVLLYTVRRMRISPAATVSIAICLAALLFFVGAGAGLWTFASLNEKFLGDATLTGRTQLWDFALQLISQRPVLGYGYEAVWGTGYEGIPYKNTLGFARVAPTGHNGYIDMLIHLGIVGLALKTIFLLAVLHCAGRLALVDARLGWLSLTIAVFVMLHNNLESDVLISSNPLSMLMMLFLMMGIRLTGSRRA